MNLPREGSAVLSLSFTPVHEAVAAIQFELEYDRSAVELIPTIGQATRSAQKALYISDVSSTKRLFIIYGLNQTPIGAGSLIDFVLGTAPGTAQGTYPVTISSVRISANDGFPVESSVAHGGITVTSGGGSALSAAGVRSAASLQDGPVAPGQIITLFGAGIGPEVSALPEGALSSPVLGGVSVWFGGAMAPLLYADQRQISAVVPFAITGETVSVEVQKNGRVEGTAQVPLQAAAPAIFSMSFSGAGPGAIINQDGTINSLEHPAPRGSIVSIYATGAGQMTPAGIDGVAAVELRTPLLPVGVTVGGVNADVLYAGSAPTLIEGILQVNARIPEDAPVGPAVEIDLTVGEFHSSAGVTLAVR